MHKAKVVFPSELNRECLINPSAFNTEEANKMKNINLNHRRYKFKITVDFHKQLA